MTIVEAVGRLLPGVMGNEESATEESFSAGLLEYPQYTRPAEFRGHRVPEVLTSGDHAKVRRWRHVQALLHTQNRRPDLLVVRGGVTAEEAGWCKEFGVHLEGVEWPPDKPKRRKKNALSDPTAGDEQVDPDRGATSAKTD
jgi:tRNA (guanine37-N1)-methyltransferase